MKKLFRATALFLSLAVLTLFCSAEAAQISGINSVTYVVMEASTGQVLAAKGEHTQMYPASITKILTCALALENGNQDDIHTMSYEATHTIGYDTTHIALDTDEQISVRDLLNATMIESANDAANGLAEYTAGSLSAFSEMMNGQVEKLGLTDTNFTNAHGLYDKNHYTSAYDMAAITRWALSVDGFRELFGAEEYTIAPTNKQSQVRRFGTHHHMLVESAYYYEGTEGGKLGWTPESQHTLVTLAKRNGMELICVVMKTKTQYEKYVDAAKLLDYCFDNYAVSNMKVSQYSNSPIPVYDGDEKVGEVVISPQEFDIVRDPTIAKADIITNLLAPEKYEKGEDIKPEIRFDNPDGQEIITMPLQWEYTEIEQDAQLLAAATAAGKDKHGFTLPAINWKMIGVCVLAFLISSIAVLLAIRAHNLRVLEQKRLKAQKRRQERERRERELSMQGLRRL